MKQYRRWKIKNNNLNILPHEQNIWVIFSTQDKQYWRQLTFSTGNRLWKCWQTLFSLPNISDTVPVSNTLSKLKVYLLFIIQLLRN